MSFDEAILGRLGPTRRAPTGHHSTLPRSSTTLLPSSPQLTPFFETGSAGPTDANGPLCPNPAFLLRQPSFPHSIRIVHNTWTWPAQRGRNCPKAQQPYSSFPEFSHEEPVIFPFSAKRQELGENHLEARSRFFLHKIHRNHSPFTVDRTSFGEHSPFRCRTPPSIFPKTIE
ncbi:hypothetical protein Droror1_Dr00008649 [Drosera rotundifolia]